MKPRYPGYFTDVPGFKLGNAEDKERATGVTVILAPDGTHASVEVRGGAPGTRETDLLKPENSVQTINAIVLSGGSAFGLDSASGVVKYLAERNIGFDTGFRRVPIVPGCVLFDLSVGDSMAFPTADMGYKACENAVENNTDMGNIGAGCGASVGKIHGMSCAMKGGLGQASLRWGNIIVSAVVAVNALGDIFDFANGNEMIAGLMNEQGERLDTVTELSKMAAVPNFDQNGRNTTIAAIATNAKLDKTGCLKVSQIAQDGYARAIHPVHTLADGDTIFTLSNGNESADANVVGVMAAEVIQRSIVNACIMAENAHDLRAYRDL